MSLSGFSDSERAQCVIWMTDYKATAVHRPFRDEYSITHRARSTIALWRADYQKRGTHTHRGGNGRPRISAKTKNRIRQLFEDNPQMSLRAAAAETSVGHAMIWNFLRKELRRLPYKLQMATSITEGHKVEGRFLLNIVEGS